MIRIIGELIVGAILGNTCSQQTANNFDSNFKDVEHSAPQMVKFSQTAGPIHIICGKKRQENLGTILHLINQQISIL